MGKPSECPLGMQSFLEVTTAPSRAHMPWTPAEVTCGIQKSMSDHTGRTLLGNHYVTSLLLACCLNLDLNRSDFLRWVPQETPVVTLEEMQLLMGFSQCALLGWAT